MPICDAKGRDCIERNSTETFHCNTTCVGIYADVQWIGESIEEELGNEQVDETKKPNLFGKAHPDLLTRLIFLEEKMKLMENDVKDMKNDIGEVMTIATGQKGEELDRKKYKMLVSEYRKFKTKNVKHFMFKSESDLSIYGES